MVEIAIIVVLLILLMLANRYSERFAKKEADPSGSFVKLYSEFGQQGHIFELKAPGYMKKVLKINPKSMDLNLTKTNFPKYDEVRRIDIWEMNDIMPNASLATDFYNVYWNPEYVYRANPAQIKHIVSVRPGERVRADFPEPVKKIMLVAVL